MGLTNWADPFRLLKSAESFEINCKNFHRMKTGEFRIERRTPTKPPVAGLSEDPGGDFNRKDSTPSGEFRNNFIRRTLPLFHEKKRARPPGRG